MTEDNGSPDAAEIEALANRSLDDLTGTDILRAELTLFAQSYGREMTPAEVEALEAALKPGTAAAYSNSRQLMRQIEKRIDGADPKSDDGRLRAASKAVQQRKDGKLGRKEFLAQLKSQTKPGTLNPLVGR